MATETLGPSITSVRFEHHHDGLSLDTGTPRISWSFSVPNNDIRNWHQISYEVELRREGGIAEHYLVDSPDSLLVPWPSEALTSREAVQARVRVLGSLEIHNENRQEWTGWSAWTTAKAAFLSGEEWSCSLIEPAATIPKRLADESLTPVRFRKRFQVPDVSVKEAMLYITAHGLYQASINGRTVGDQLMAPGWTSYKHRLQYQSYSVTDLVEAGSECVLDVQVAAGWYASALGWAGGRRCRFGDTLGLLAQLEVSFHDQEKQRFIVATDDSWKSALSPIVQSEIYNGETYDARQELVDDTDSQWQPVQIGPFPEARLISPQAPPVRVTQEIKPVKIFQTPSNKTIIDFGQNLVGKLRVNFLQKPKGHEVRFWHAEVMEKGELGTRPIRFAKSTNIIISNGDEIRNWTALFTFHGFRYVQVDGWSASDGTNPLTLESVTALVMHTDMKRTGWFECSHELVNKLHENAVWSMRGNFLSIPTDCPQRDERLGWTGDIQVFSPSANFLYDTSSMLGGWLEDVAVEQLRDGGGIPPFVVPNVIGRDDEAVEDEWWPHVPNAVWDDVVIILPWDLYRAFGDVGIFAKQYESMQAWIDRGVDRGPDGLWSPEKWQLGDWLDPAAPPSEPGNGRTDGVLVADAYLVRITLIMSQVTRILGREDESIRYTQSYAQLKAAFQQKYITPAGLLASDSQTALALAFVFDLFVNPQQQLFAAERLIRAVRQAQFRVSTGFAGTPIILHALSKIGRSQYAYRMLMEKRCPSWMYPVLMGATTIWERWDSMLDDGSINPGEMTSFNHYALGSVVNWLHEVVGGISPLTPGWQQILVRPVPGATLTHSFVRHTSPYGEIEASWRVNNQLFVLELVVPPNSRAHVILPDQQKNRIGEGDESGIWVGSGKHTFSCQCPKMDDWPLTAMHPQFWPQPRSEAV